MSLLCLHLLGCEDSHVEDQAGPGNHQVVIIPAPSSKIDLGPRNEETMCFDTLRWYFILPGEGNSWGFPMAAVLASGTSDSQPRDDLPSGNDSQVAIEKWPVCIGRSHVKMVDLSKVIVNFVNLYQRIVKLETRIQKRTLVVSTVKTHWIP